MRGINQPNPNAAESQGYKPEAGDELSDAELRELLRQCGANVPAPSPVAQKGYVDLDAIFGTDK